MDIECNDVRIYDVEPPTHCMVHGLERKKENKKDIDWETYEESC